MLKAAMISFLKVFLFSQFVPMRQIWILEFFISTSFSLRTWASEPTQARTIAQKNEKGQLWIQPWDVARGTRWGWPVSSPGSRGRNRSTFIHAPLHASSFLSLSTSRSQGGKVFEGTGSFQVQKLCFILCFRVSIHLICGGIFWGFFKQMWIKHLLCARDYIKYRYTVVSKTNLAPPFVELMVSSQGKTLNE